MDSGTFQRLEDLNSVAASSPSPASNADGSADCAGARDLCEGLTRNGFAIPLWTDVPAAFGALGAFILASPSPTLIAHVMIHIDYLAERACVAPAAILSGKTFENDPKVLCDTLINIAGELRAEADRHFRHGTGHARASEATPAPIDTETTPPVTNGHPPGPNADANRRRRAGITAGSYRRIYHYHLKKCGGSTLNQWLDTLTSDTRTMNPKWTGSWLLGDREEERKIKRDDFDAAKANSVFHWSDVVHTHAALRARAPADTFCMTVLRDPVARLVSQVSDWRRLEASDAAVDPGFIQRCVADSRTMNFRQFLEHHAFSDARMLFDNYMTRALAAGRIGRLVLEVDDAERLLDIALQSLETDYDFVGLTEELDLSRNAMCALLGVPPAKPVSVLNESRTASARGPGGHEAADLIARLTASDAVIYRRARQLFDVRFRPAGETYNARSFETQSASHVLGALRGFESEDCTRYSVRDAIIGSGFHGRDSAGTDTCAVWSGPGPRSTLYIPVPPDMKLCVLVWVRDFAAPRQRDSLRVAVDGRSAEHRFMRADGYAGVLRVETCTGRDFVRLDLDVGETACCLEPGRIDPRQRGLAIDGYGWRRA